MPGAGGGIVRLRRRRQFRHQRRAVRGYSAAALGTPLAAKRIERLQRIRIRRQRFRRRQRRRIGIADPDQDVEQGRRHDAAQRHVVGRFRVGSLASASLLPCCAISALCARIGASICGDAFVDRGEIRRRGAPSRGADFTSLTRSRELFRLRARGRELAAQRGERFLQRARCARPRAGSAQALRLLAFDSRPATRAVRSSIAAALTCGGGRRGGLHRGPAQQPADADHQRGRDRAGDRRNDPRRNRLRDGGLGDRLSATRLAARLGRGAASAAAPARARLAGSRARSTPRSPRDRWSAARAWAGPDRAAVQCLRACHRPSQRFLEQLLAVAGT